MALSGGEPSSHPQILELIRIASRPQIGRVVLITNGLRLGRDPSFARCAQGQQGLCRSAARRLFCGIASQLIRGRDLTEEKKPMRCACCAS